MTIDWSKYQYARELNQLRKLADEKYKLVVEN